MKFVEPTQRKAAHGGATEAATARRQVAVEGAGGVLADKLEEVILDKPEECCRASGIRGCRVARIHGQMPVESMKMSLGLPINA